MEHGPLTFAEAGDLCRIASGLGLLTMIRISDTRRENVLKAAELAPDIIDVPMVNTPEEAADLVRHARYAPEGQRGYFGISRAVRYGVLANGIREEQRRVNESLCLMVQVETAEAVKRTADICSVPGIDAIFLGPGDLSVSLGVTGETRHPRVQEAMAQTIRIAREKGKRVAMFCAPADAQRWAKAGVDLLFCGGNTSCLRMGAETILAQAASGKSAT
jgi:2-keto-3-deoxy-L-rhamnonate aldolase RhmA